MSDLLAEEIRREGATLIKIVRYCTEEVVRQRANPDAVYWMVAAWLVTLRGFRMAPLGTLPNDKQIEEWGKRVEPVKNALGYRDCEVRVGDRLCPPAAEVRHLMRDFCTQLPTLTPEHAYHQFQLIHPFRDGNGRTGKILYNWLTYRLDNPLMPPDFFGVANP